MLQPGSEFGEGGAPASPKRVRTAKRLGGRRKESLQEEQDLEEEEEELDSDPEAAAAQNQSKGKRGRRLDPAAQAAKLAAAREKNRLAQQRFRERQRIKQKVAGAQCIVVAKHIEEVGGHARAARPGSALQPSGCVHPPVAYEQRTRLPTANPAHASCDGRLVLRTCPLDHISFLSAV